MISLIVIVVCFLFQYAAFCFGLACLRWSVYVCVSECVRACVCVCVCSC